MLEHILRGNLLRGRKKKSRLRATELPEDNNVVFVHEMTPAPWHQTGIKLGYYRWTIEPSPMTLLTRLLDSA